MSFPSILLLEQLVEGGRKKRTLCLDRNNPTQGMEYKREIQRSKNSNWNRTTAIPRMEEGVALQEERDYIAEACNLSEGCVCRFTRFNLSYQLIFSISRFCN